MCQDFFLLLWTFEIVSQLVSKFMKISVRFTGKVDLFLHILILEEGQKIANSKGK